MKLKEIKYAAWNTRGTIAPESVKELAQSIAEQGLINPITIWMDANGEPVCIAGNRRLAALLCIRDYEDEIAESEYKVFDGTEHEAKMVTVTENLQREDVGIIEEAALVAKCLDEGMNADEIAARAGRSTAWVNRRRKLISLDKVWHGSALPAVALEKIAELPEAAQKRLAKSCKSATNWEYVKWSYDRELRNLDSAKFAATRCSHCEKRTGVQPDLFGECDGKLGSCLDCVCFDKSHKEWREKAIVAEIGDAEHIEVQYGWQMPDEEHSSEKRTREYPCAYCHFDTEDELEIVWGESAEAKQERIECEQANRDAENEAERAERAKLRAVTGKLSDAYDSYDNDPPKELEAEVEKMLADMDENHLAAVIDIIVKHICQYHGDDEWANLVRTFDFVAKLAGLDDEEREYLLAECPEEDEDEAEDEADEEPEDESEIEDNEDNESEEAE